MKSWKIQPEENNQNPILIHLRFVMIFKFYFLPENCFFKQNL